MVNNRLVIPDILPDIVTSSRRLPVSAFIEPVLQVPRPPNKGQRFRPRKLSVLAGAITKILDHFVILISLPSFIEPQELVHASLTLLLNVDLVYSVLPDLLLVAEDLLLKIRSLGIEVREDRLIAVDAAPGMLVDQREV